MGIDGLDELLRGERSSGGQDACWLGAGEVTGPVTRPSCCLGRGAKHDPRVSVFGGALAQARRREQACLLVTSLTQSSVVTWSS